MGTIEFDGPAEQAEAGIVDDVFDLDVRRRERGDDLVAGIRLFVIASDHDRQGFSGSGDFIGQYCQPILAPACDRHTMAVRRKDARHFRAYPRRGPGNQRYTFGHDQKLLSSIAGRRLATPRREHRGKAGCKTPCRQAGTRARPVYNKWASLLLSNPPFRGVGYIKVSSSPMTGGPREPFVSIDVFG